MSDDEKKDILKQLNRELDGFHAVLCMGIRCIIAAYNDVSKLVELLEQVGDIELSNGEKLSPILMSNIGDLMLAAYGHLDVSLGFLKLEDRGHFDSLLVRGEDNA